ncbi:uncharacterized protein FYW61_006649 [Anableps anableps]
MAEEEVCYASVVIKSKTQPQSKVKNENETIYDEVKVNKEPDKAKTVKEAEVEKQNESVQQTRDTTGLQSDKAAERFCRDQQLACSFGILCVILVLIIIGVWVYLRVSTASELEQLRSSQQVLLEENRNLTNLNNKLSSDYENLTVRFDNLTTASTALENKITVLTVENHNLTTASTALENKITVLTVENHNLTTASTALENKITVLTAENHNLTFLNEELKQERKNLTELIKNMEKTWNELNVSRAQWSIDEYCPKESGGRSCTSCQKGWNYQLSSCYAYNDFPPSDQKNWEDARETCRTKISDLPVVSNQAEKDYVQTQSPVIYGISGYWIGLRAVGGTWKWIDGSDLTNQTWMQQPADDGQCVTSLRNRGWRSVSCDDRNAWICEKKALSV